MIPELLLGASMLSLAALRVARSEALSERRRTAGLRRACRRLGWTYRAVGGGSFHVDGRTGNLDWTLHVGGAPPRTRWHSAGGRLPRGGLLAGPAPRRVGPGLAFEGVLRQLLLDACGGKPGATLEATRPIGMPGDALRLRYALYATDEALAREWLAAGADAALLGFSLESVPDARPVVAVDADGVRLNVPGRLCDPDELGRVVELGFRLASIEILSKPVED